MRSTSPSCHQPPPSRLNSVADDLHRLHRRQDPAAGEIAQEFECNRDAGAFAILPPDVRGGMTSVIIMEVFGDADSVTDLRFEGMPE